MSQSVNIEDFNALPPDEAGERLAACLPVPRWVTTVSDGRPYADWPALEAAAASAAAHLDDARARGRPGGPPAHRRTGVEPATTTQRSAPGSSRGVDPADAEVARELAAGNAAYEERFGPGVPHPGRGPLGPRDPRRAATSARQRRRHRARRDRDPAARDRVAPTPDRWSPDGHPLHARPRHQPRAVPRTGSGWCSRASTAAPRRRGITDSDGRVGSIGPERLEAGDYRLRFASGAYFARHVTTTASTPRWSWCSPSPTPRRTTTCRCCSTRSATPPTGAADRHLGRGTRAHRPRRLLGSGRRDR